MRSSSWVCFLYCCLCGIAVSADDTGFLDTRAWTSNDGKVLQANLVEADSYSVVLKIAKTGREVEIPLDRLSEKDRTSVQAWLRSHPDGVAPPRPPFLWPNRYTGEQQPPVKYLGKDDKRGTHVYRTTHFDLHADTELSESTVSKCAAVFDSIVGALDSLPLGLDPIPEDGSERYDALLLSSRQLYHQQGGPPNSAGVFIPNRGLTMMPYASLGIVKKGNQWVFDGSRRDFGVLVHELTHQAILLRWFFLPIWFHEGIADYMQAMPYRSGQFLFTNPGAAVTQNLRDGAGQLWREFPCLHLETLLHMEHATWNAAVRSDPRRSFRNYASAQVAVWYFMHVDGNGDGAHFIAWIHDLKSQFPRHQRNWAAKKRELTEKHLLRDRTWAEVESELREAMQAKGQRILFAP